MSRLPLAFPDEKSVSIGLLPNTPNTKISMMDSDPQHKTSGIEV